MTAGRYIALEGAEGCGKSTQAAALATALDAQLTRETGGTAIGLRIRDILHDVATTGLAARAEALQELLGEHQDTVVARTVLAEIGLHAQQAGEDAFTFGRLHALEEARGAAIVAAYPEVLAELPSGELRKWLTH